MKKYFQKQFTFNEWANKKIIELILFNNINAEPILSLLSHLISVEEMWLERLKQTPDYLIDIWETFSIQEIEVLSNNNSTGWQKFIKRQNKNNFNKITCSYPNSNGKEVTYLFIDIMQQVLTHSNYHRGQINLLLKELNLELPKINFINFIDEKI